MKDEAPHNYPRVYKGNFVKLTEKSKWSYEYSNFFLFIKANSIFVSVSNIIKLI